MRPRIGPPPEPLVRTPLERVLEKLPFGIGVRKKPRHFLDMARVLFRNRGRLGYAWRILKHGVCDGCSLGPKGLRDDVIDGVHLCTTRLNLLRLNTMGAFDPSTIPPVDLLRKRSNEQLQELGRIPQPLVRRRGEGAFRPVSWDEALDLAAERMRAIDPDRMAWFATSRGITNEVYYVFQKVARMLGSPHIDYCARLCHAPSVYGLADTLGVGAPNCSLRDMIGTDLLVLWGTNLANNQPVTTKYMHHAKKLGTRIAVVNPFREPGLERYWVPSVPSSALFGTRLMDDYYPVAIGGDIAFVNGVLKALKERGGMRLSFLRHHTSGIEEMMRKLDAFSWKELEEASGLPKAEMLRFAAIYAQAETAVFVYSMGLTQQQFGVENVRSVATLALVRGMVGRPKCGIMPIRGHSGVQGGSECGVSPDKFPAGLPVDEENAKRFSEEWGRPVPSRPGYTTPRMIEAAHEGRVDFLYSIGGNLYETMPDPRFVAEAIGRIGLRIHNDIVLNTSTLLEGDLTIVLPATTRYEMAGGCTSTSTERRVRFSPEISGPRIAGAKSEWEALALLAKRVIPDVESRLSYRDASDIRVEMERLLPLYRGIAGLKEEGDAVQWGGERLFEGGTFEKMPGGKARLWVQELPKISVPDGWFHLTTRRGKQFNSMKFAEHDPLTGGASRTTVFMHAADARELGLGDGDPIIVRSDIGEMGACVKIAAVRPRTLQAFWPESNVLIPRRYDPISGEPDYNVFVQVRRA